MKTADNQKGARSGTCAGTTGLVQRAGAKNHVTGITGSGGAAEQIVVGARGAVYNGVWPQMSVRVNGTDQPDKAVNTTAYANYIFSATLTDNDVIAVVYSNDEGSRWTM